MTQVASPLSQFSNLSLPYGAQVGGALILPVSAGKVLYVGSAVATARNAENRGLTPAEPLATIVYAISLCTASAGDIIFVLPGHTETIAAAAGIAVNKAGISIIGLGNGRLRPTIAWSATDSTMVISAANVTIANIITKSTVNECVSMISVTGVGCTLDGVDFQSTGAALEAIQWLTASTAATDLTIKNCRHYQATAAASAQVWISLNSTAGSRIVDNTFQLLLFASTSSFTIGAVTCTNLEISRNVMVQLGATCTKMIDAGASTGIISYNSLGGGASVVQASGITATAAYKNENYLMDLGGIAGSGLITPAGGTF